MSSSERDEGAVTVCCICNKQGGLTPSGGRLAPPGGVGPFFPNQRAGSWAPSAVQKKQSMNFMIPTGRTNKKHRGHIAKALMRSRRCLPVRITRLGSRLAGPDCVHLRSFPTAIFSCDACLDAIAAPQATLIDFPVLSAHYPGGWQSVAKIIASACY